MGALDGKFEVLLSSVQHVSDAVGELKKSTGIDHDKLIALDATWASDKKTIFSRLNDLSSSVQTAQLSAVNAVNALQTDIKGGVKTHDDRRFTFITALVTAIISVVGAWVVAKYTGH